MQDMPMLRPYLVPSRVWLQAAQIWPILTGFVMFSDRNPTAPATMTYGDLATRMGYSTRNAGHTLARPLGLIGHLCIASNVAALNSIVVTQHTGAPGDEVLLHKRRTIAQEQAEVMKTDWHNWRAPTSGTFRRVWEAVDGFRSDRTSKAA